MSPSTIEITLTTDQVKSRPVNEWLEAILRSRDFDYEIFCVPEMDKLRAVVTVNDLDLI